MAKISKKRFLELVEDFYLDVEDKNSFAGKVYAELNKPKNKWITWNGGDCPVSPETKVHVKFRDGEVYRNGIAKGWNWKHWGVEEHDYDIIAYKVIDNS